MKNQINKLQKEILKKKDEIRRKDEVINGILNCSDKGINAVNKDVRNNLLKISNEAEMAVCQVKFNNIQTELLFQIAENESNINTIKSLKIGKRALEESNARQKVTIDKLMDEIQNCNQILNEMKTLNLQYLETIKSLEEQQTQLIPCIKTSYSNNENFEVVEKIDLKGPELCNDLEEIFKCLSEENEILNVNSAIQKITKILCENKTLKSQLEYYQKQSTSYECEQSLSRETIVRLANDVKIEKSKNEEFEEKLAMVTKKMPTNSDYDIYVNNHIKCLSEHLSDLRRALKSSLQDNLEKSQIICKFKERSNVNMSLSECLKNLEIFIAKIDENLQNNEGEQNNMEEINFLNDFIKKINSHFQHFPF